MKKYLTLALAATFTVMNGMSASAGNGQAATGTYSGGTWPAPLTFKSAKTTRNSQGFYNTLTPAEKSSRNSANSNKVIAKSVSRTLNLCGSLLYSSTWTTEPKYGVYSIPTNTQQSFNCLYSTPYMVNSYWESKDGKAYIVAEESFGSMSFYTMYVYDTETGEKLQTINLDNSNLVCTDLAEDPTTGDIYGCGLNSSTSSYYWRKVNFETQEYSNIAKLPGQLIGVGCDKNGQYYAMGTNTVLYKVNKTTGELTPLYQTKIPAQYNVGGCYNDENDTFLQTSSTDDFGRLYEIDINTGQATMVYEFPAMEEVTNLHFQKPLAELKAPAAGEFMILPTDDGSLTVEAMLTMPAELFDGTEIKSGTSLTYYIEIDGVPAKSGKAAAGEDVSTTVDVPSSGIHSFAFCTANEVGKSPKVYESCYVGSAVPNATAKATLSITNGTATISWDAVSTTATEGYFDASQIKYAVYDMDGKQVAGPVAGLTTTVAAPNPDKFTILKYSVAALMNDAASEHTPTNGIIFGYMDTPCQIDGREQDFYDAFKIIDSNNDGCTWIFDGFNTGYTNTEMPDDKKQDANDWLITNGVYLKANHLYTVSTTFTTTSWSGAQETIDIMCGSSQTPDAMTIVINKAQTVSGFSSVKGTLSVPADGVYYLGYHVTSEKEQEGISLQWVDISEGISLTAPAAPENLKGEADVDGEPKATLTFTFPSKTMEGNAISGALKMAIYAEDQLLKEVPGNASETATAEVTVPGTGQIDFELRAVNAAGEAGNPATIRVNVGPRKPGTPASVTAYQKENGKLIISWSAVTADTNNKAIKEEYITYNIHFANGGYVGDLIESGVKGTTYTFDSGLTSGQEFYQFVVIASNRGVTGSGRGSLQTPTGVPYTIPFKLSHQNDLQKYIVAESAPNTTIGFVSDQEGMASADGDGQFIGMVFDKYTSANATYGRLYTGLINLSGVVNPTLSFYVYKFGNDDDNYSTCGILVDGKYTKLLDVKNSSLPGTGWNKVSVSLDKYGGNLAQIDIRGYYNGKDTNKLYAFDAIAVTSKQRYDIEATVDAPASVEPGQSFTVKAKATNVGSNNATSYTLNLYRGDDLLKSVKNTSLATDASATISVTETLNVTDPTSVEYRAEVSYNMDRNTDNNVASAIVKRNLSKLQGVENVKAERSDDGKVQISWDFAATTSDAGNTLTGFNVYADGVRLNASPVSETTYTHAATKESSYQVSAAYQNGESELSEAVKAGMSGITGIICGNVKVSVDGSQIKISGAEYRNVTIISADGTVVYSGSGDASVGVATGVYMVCIDGQTLKVMVK